MKLHSSSEQQILELLRGIDFEDAHEEVRIVGNPESVCVYVRHKGFTRDPESGAPVQRVDANVYPTLAALEKLQLSVGQGQLGAEQPDDKKEGKKK